MIEVNVNDDNISVEKSVRGWIFIINPNCDVCDKLFLSEGKKDKTPCAKGRQSFTISENGGIHKLIFQMPKKESTILR